jgi:flagellar FliL protein
MAEDLEEDFDEDEGGESALPEKGGKPGLKKILLIVVPVLLVIGLGAGLYFSGVLNNLFGSKESTAGGEEEAGKSEEAAPPVEKESKAEHGGEKKEKKAKKGEGGGNAVASVFMDLPDMLVNLQSTGRKQSFLKIHVALELENPMDQPKVDAVMPRIVDSFQVYLRELRPDDLQGAAGMHLLREELLSRVSLAVQPVKVKDVLFREILIQ